MNDDPCLLILDDLGPMPYVEGWLSPLDVELGLITAVVLPDGTYRPAAANAAPRAQEAL